ncbi:MAG: PhnD/SsuA/transferrin family substrate-binding protein [Hyphomicrobiales bacterium]|nr:PhnD/SsuA/transferrin family substrate-binding protein [Hyphomicrobiales bacterium]
MIAGALVAALPMYDDPGTAEANDSIWAAIAASMRQRSVAAPAKLTRGGDLAAQWRSSSLVFGQTCGYPFVKGLRDAVRLIATPEYAFPGCEGIYHRSFLVRGARDPRRGLEAFRSGVAAINGPDSNSGMNLFRATIAPVAEGRAFFGAVVTTGSHLASLEAVADGRADLAAIDCVSFALMKRLSPDLVARVAVVAESPLSPGLPFIMSARLPEATLACARNALFDVLADPDLADALAVLGLKGARVTTPADYERILEIERDAAAAGYPTLA